MSESERDAMLQECSAYDEVLRKSGYFIDGKALQGVQTATTLQFRGGKMTVTDGPFAETKEQLGGVMVLEARDLSHAIQLMSHLPNRRARRIGSVRSRAMGSNTSSPAAPRT
jgi:hypothetical protein